NPSGPYSGIKRSLTDGGIRVPAIAWWPGTVEAGTESSHVGYFGDLFATAAELSGADAPSGLDSISVVPVLRGDVGRQRSHDLLYWEFHEGGFRQAALLAGRWKGHRRGAPDAPLQVFDLYHDPGERRDVSAAQPGVTARLDAYLR